MNHVLVIGGTGMLRGVCLDLAREGAVVSVLARNADRLDRLRRDAEPLVGRIDPISTDYHDTPALRGSIRRLDPIDLVVAWIHSTAPETPMAIAEAASRCDFLHVLGARDIGPVSAEPLRNVAEIDGVRYRTVTTGFIIEAGSSRWLTHEEICAGVLTAIKTGRDRSIIGTVEPWSAHP